MIGLAAGALALFNGRVAGISGIVGALLRPRRNDSAWRVAFVVGLVAAPLACATVAPWPAPQIDTSWPALVLAGLLVGLGTRYGAGCTSGHGVCGLARRSGRSLAAVIVFMASAFATVFVLRQLLGS